MTENRTLARLLAEADTMMVCRLNRDLPVGPFADRLLVCNARWVSDAVVKGRRASWDGGRR